MIKYDEMMKIYGCSNRIFLGLLIVRDMAISKWVAARDSRDLVKIDTTMEKGSTQPGSFFNRRRFEVKNL